MSGAARLYRKQLPLLIADWRQRWGQGDFPFLWVQLPNFKKRQEAAGATSAWAVMRDSMFKCLKLPHTGIAVTIDVGEAKNIHPKNKQAVGDRLARWALAEVYGKDTPASGPLPPGTGTVPLRNATEGRAAGSPFGASDCLRVDRERPRNEPLGAPDEGEVARKARCRWYRRHGRNALFHKRLGDGPMVGRVPAPGLQRLRSVLIAAALCGATAATLSAQSYGSAEFFSTTSAGKLQSIRKHVGFRKTWHEIVPGNFGGSWHSDLFCYDKISGDGVFYTGDGRGNLKELRHLYNFHKGWDRVIAGNFGGSSYTDLLFYDRHTGKAEFYTTDGAGRISFLRRTLWSDWDVILAGNFGGSPHSDIFFYSRMRGEAGLYLTDGKGGLIRKYFSKRWHKYWDIVVPGRLNADAITDLVCYSQVTGDMLTYTVNKYSYPVFLRTAKMPTHWDIIVPLRDPRYTTSKFLFYDRNAGNTQLATVTTSGLILLKPQQPASKRWFSIAPGYFDGDTSMDVLCYDNTYRVRIRAIRCMDDNGGRAARINPSQVKLWVDDANKVYASAGVFFEFDPMGDYEELRSTLLNNLHDCTKSSNPTLCKQSADAATKYAARCPRKIAVFFRHGPGIVPTGQGMSSGKGNIVVMPGFDVTRTSLYFHNPKTPGHSTVVQNISLLAHELGHYLAIGHTFVDPPYASYKTPHAAVVAYMKTHKATTMDVLDGDRAGIADTPPDVHAAYYIGNLWNPANRYREITIKSLPDKIDFSFNTDRYDVMSYWPICDNFKRVSPDQRRRVREWLNGPYRKPLISGTVGGLTRFGIGCKASWSTAATHTAMGCPRPGNVVTYKLTYGYKNQVALFSFGGTRYRLPIDLGFLGAPGCKLYSDQLFSLVSKTNSRGEAAVPLGIPNIPQLAGAHGFTQFACVAPNGNGWKLAMTNAVDTRFGN